MQSTDTESWKPVVGYEGMYEVSDHGRVRSVDRTIVRSDGVRTRLPGRILNPVWSGAGNARRYRVKITRNRPMYVHRLVLEAFVGPAPLGTEGCHNDGNPRNNRLRNLRWDTHAENNRDTVRHGAHGMTNRAECPYGHVLQAPNLVLAGLRAGVRQCRACANGRKRAKDRGVEFTAEIAAECYAKIMG